MEKAAVTRPTVVIVGPTASGKTGLSIELALRHSGEILAADSRTIYSGLNIGTAKPTAEERRGVPHWGLDLIGPDARYSVAAYQQYAYETLHQIREREHIPFLTGGSGLYVNSIIYDYTFIEIDERLKAKLEAMDLEELRRYCLENNIQLSKNPLNKRHLIGHILRNGNNNSSGYRLASPTVVVGITTDSALLKERMYKRAADMFSHGVIDEASHIASVYGWECPGLTGNIYQVVRQLLAGELSLEEAITRSATLDWQLAKRQMTWFKRDPNIKWLQLDEAEHYLSDILTEYE